MISPSVSFSLFTLAHSNRLELFFNFAYEIDAGVARVKNGQIIFILTNLILFFYLLALEVE